MTSHTCAIRISLALAIAMLAACSSSNGDSSPAATGGGTTTTPPPAANQAPTVSGTSAKSMDSDDTTTTSFTVADTETPAADLTVSVASSDTALLRAESLVLGGSGATRTLQLTPTEDRSGRTTLVVTVRDAQGATGTASFVLDVLSAPTSLVALTGDTFARPATEAATSLTGKSFTPDSEDPALFDGLINATP